MDYYGRWGKCDQIKKSERFVVPFPIPCGHCHFCSRQCMPDAVGMEEDTWYKVGNVIHLQKRYINALLMDFNAVRRGGTVSIVGLLAIRMTVQASIRAVKTSDTIAK